MFEPFFTTKAVGKGTDLGLSISIKIVTDHYGIMTSNHSKNGVAFVISLPVSQNIS